MSLAKKFYSDPMAAQNGTWVDYPDARNEDQSVPGFLLARMSRQNKDYTRESRELLKGYDKEEDGTPIIPTGDEDANVALLDKLVAIFCRTVLRGWRNFKDIEGNDIPYSPENAYALFKTDGPWEALYSDLKAKAEAASTFAVKRQAALEKN